MAHREAGVVVCEGCGALAGIGWHPHWAGQPLPRHSRLGSGNEQTALRCRAGSPRSLASPGQSPGALRHTGQEELTLMGQH